MNNYTWNIIVSALLGVFLLITGNLFLTSVGLAFAFYIFVKLLMDMGRKIPIIELMTALAALQWILGPFIEYGRELEHYKYRMYVDEATYMAFVVPAVIVFWIGANLIKPKTDLDSLKLEIDKILKEHPLFPYILIIAGALIPFLSGLFPASLGFVFFLLSMMKYIGVIYLIHSSQRFKWPIFFGVLLVTAISSIGAGMFHDLILWSMLLFTFLAKEWKMSLPMKLFSALMGILFAMTIQSVKLQYRMQTWSGEYEGSKTLLFVSMAAHEWSSGEVFLPKQDVHMNVRLNQGWIISAIMYNVPAVVPFANGRTITDAIENSLIPRVLYPGKPTAGGRENFRKYTGLSLSDGTSMGISIAGEGYANYGWFGGIVFMFLWGLFINWFWRRLEAWSKYFPTLLVWSPILFLQVVKAETEFGVVLNHLIKATIVVGGLVWGIRMVWGESGSRPESRVFRRVSNWQRGRHENLENKKVPD